MDEEKVDEMPLVSEMYNDLKQANKFKEKVIISLLLVICLLIIALAGTNVYLVYKWGEFNTDIVDHLQNDAAEYSQPEDTAAPAATPAPQPTGAGTGTGTSQGSSSGTGTSQGSSSGTH